MVAAVAVKNNRKPARAKPPALVEQPAEQGAPAERGSPDYTDVEGEMIRVYVPELVGSKYNVRFRANDNSPVEGLADSIVATGLASNLVVVDDLDEHGSATGKRGVAAGDRRRRALQLALEDGRWPADRPVWAKRVSHEVARLLSLSENCFREAMHPADEFVAFRDLRDEGFSEATIAAAFRVTPAVVRGRMRLANVAPELLALFRQGVIDIDHMMAFALTDDHKAQMRVWNALPKQGLHAHLIRQAITVNELPCGHARVKFVGITAYRKAGGPVREDLFGEKDACFVQDLELLDRLGVQKLASRVKAVEAEGWGWVEVRPVFKRADAHAFDCLPMGYLGDPSNEQQKELSAIARELAPLQAAMDALAGVESLGDEDAQRWELLSEQAETLIARQEALVDDFHGLSLAALRAAGAIVSIGENGRSAVVRGLVRPADRQRVKEALSAAGPGATSPAQGDGGEEEREGAPARFTHSERLVRKLTANKTVALQRVLVDNHHVALAALSHKLLCDLGFGGYRKASAVQLSARAAGHEVKLAEEGIESNRAHLAMQEKLDAWKARLDGEGDDANEQLLQRLLALTGAELVEVLALCTALCVNVVTGDEGKPHPGDDLARALRFDMADHWEATGESYLSHVSKTQVLSVIASTVSADEAANLDKHKKPDLVAAAEAHLAGRRWLPAPLVTPEAP